MLHLLLTLLLNRIHTPVALTIAGVGLLVGLVGARFSKAIISLSLVSAGTIIGLHMPRWFGWGIDPMGTAFGAAILLGMSGYVLTVMWEGILLATMLAVISGAAVWLKLAPQEAWHWPHLDFSGTAMEIGYAVWQSLPAAINRALPVGIGVGATIGTLLMAFTPRLGRVLFYSILGMGVFGLGAWLGIRLVRPELWSAVTRDPWIRGAIYGGAVILASGVQRMFLPKTATAKFAIRSDKSGSANRFVANGPAMRVQSRSAGFGSSQPRPAARAPHAYRIPGRIR